MSQILNECGCCGFGFETFRPVDILYHNSALDVLTTYNRKTGIAVEDFPWDRKPTHTQQIQLLAAVTNRGFLYGYNRNLNSAIPGLNSVSKRNPDGSVIWDTFASGGDGNSTYTSPISHNFSASNSTKIDVLKSDGNVVIGGSRIIVHDNGSVSGKEVLVFQVVVNVIDDDGNTISTFIFSPPSYDIDTTAYPLANSVVHGYQLLDLCITSEGNIHLTGIASLTVRRHLSGITTYWERYGRFEMQIDFTGAELWSDIHVFGIPGSDPETSKSIGYYCVADDADNVHVLYNGTAGGGSDNLRMVGFDNAGTEFYLKTTPFSLGTSLVVHNGVMYLATNTFNLEKHSDPTFSTLEWSKTDGDYEHVSIDNVGDLYTSRFEQPFGAPINRTRKKFTPAGVEKWSHTSEGFITRPVVPPGIPPQYIS